MVEMVREPGPTPWRDALRYWEPRRLLYNLALGGLVVSWVVRTWPAFRPAFSLEALGQLTVLALLANLCYSAAYLVDIPLQGAGASYRRWRWVLWTAGTVLAVLFAHYWIGDEIYPYLPAH